MTTKLHAVTDAKGRPIGFFMSAGQVSDYTCAAALPGSLPKVDWLLADRGHDADWLRDALKDNGIRVCILGRKSRKKTVKYDKRRYKRRNLIEIMFGRLKDWRRVAIRYDQFPETFLSAILLAATVLYCLLNSKSLEPYREDARGVLRPAQVVQDLSPYEQGNSFSSSRIATMTKVVGSCSPVKPRSACSLTKAAEIAKLAGRQKTRSDPERLKKPMPVAALTRKSVCCS